MSSAKCPFLLDLNVLTRCGIVPPHGDIELYQIGRVIGSLPAGTKSLHEQVLAYRQ